jgi:membrane-bound lytic murein transglycosylase D
MTATGKQSFKTLVKSSAPLKDETRHYVPKFLAMLKITQSAKKLGFNAPDMRASKDLQEVRIPAGTELAGLAGHIGLTWEQFHALNPAYRRQVSPPDRVTAAWVPKRLAQPALAYADNPTRGKGSAGVRLARGGETWWTLSRETGIPANLLRDCNKGLDTPAPGKTLMIPLAACAQDAGATYDPVKPGKFAPAAATAVAQASSQQSAPSGLAQPTLYIVRKGDTLETVAQKTGVGVQDLISFNKANPKDTLIPGTPLLIPGKAQAANVAQAQPAQERPAGKQAEQTVERTDLNPSPKYKIIRRSGT